MGIDYAWQKTMTAVTSMAADPDSIQDRIASAFVNSLIHIEPERDLPEELRSLLADIRSALTTTPAKGDEGMALASARILSTEEARVIARKIVDLYDQVCVARPTR